MDFLEEVSEETSEEETNIFPLSAPVEGEDISVEREAVRLFSLYGSLARVSRELNIDLYHLQKMARTQWWAEEYSQLQRLESAQKNAALTRVLDITLDKLEDRVQKGDLIYKGGKLVRQPLTAAVLAKVADVVFDKRQLIRNQPTVILDGNSKLESLARKLRALGAKDPELMNLPVETIEARELPSQERSFLSATFVEKLAN